VRKPSFAELKNLPNEMQLEFLKRFAFSDAAAYNIIKTLQGEERP